MSGQTKVPMPAATPRIPPTMFSQRSAGTRLATTSWVMPPNSKATPTNVATATRLPTLYDSTSMPNPIHSAPRATSHHEVVEASRAPSRTVSRSGSGGGVVRLLRLGGLAEPAEHVGAGDVPCVVAPERQPVDQSEGDLRAVQLRDRDCAVECDDRRRV